MLNNGFVKLRKESNKKRIKNLFSCNVSVTFGETDQDGVFEYSAYFDDYDDYCANCNDERIDKNVARIFRQFGGEMYRYDAESDNQTLWWMMDEN